jgi:hypothetical protein
MNTRARVPVRRLVTVAAAVLAAPPVAGAAPRGRPEPASLRRCLQGFQPPAGHPWGDTRVDARALEGRAERDTVVEGGAAVGRRVHPVGATVSKGLVAGLELVEGPAMRPLETMTRRRQWVRCWFRDSETGGLRRLALLLTAAVLLLVAADPVGAADRDRVVGYPRSATPAFELERGRFSAFDLPGNGPGEFVRTNDRGDIVGSFADDDGTLTGFLRDPRGRVKTFDAPDGTHTTPLDIDNRRRIVGNVCDTPATCPTEIRGFVRDPNGRFQTIRVPGSARTQVYGINQRGQLVGDYTLPDGSIHGYLWSHGRFVTIDGPDGTGATLTAINDRGDLVGVYAPDPTNPNGGLAGFVLRKGRYHTFAVPGTRVTLPLGINNRGQVAGYTTTGPDLRTGARGFLLTRGVNGPLTRIDVPGAAATGVTDIDDRGRIVGLYDNRATTASAPDDPARTDALVLMAGLAHVREAR